MARRFGARIVRMTATVVIATCDRPDRLVKALLSVHNAIRYSGRPHKIIVVDNGIRTSAGSCASALPPETASATTFVSSERRNKSRALNFGIAGASTEWVAFTDDDCIPDEKWLAEASVFADRTGLRIFGGRVLPGEPGFPLPAWLKPGRSGLTPIGPAFVKYEPMPMSGVLDNRMTVPFGANTFVHRSIFDRYGLYDEGLWRRCGKAALGAEDAEFAMRIRRRGECVGYCAEALVSHPVYRERATAGFYLKSAYRSGIRDALMPWDCPSPSARFLLKDAFLTALRSARAGILMDSAAAMLYLCRVMMRLGQMIGYLRIAANAAVTCKAPGSRTC